MASGSRSQPVRWAVMVSPIKSPVSQVGLCVSNAQRNAALNSINKPYTSVMMAWPQMREANATVKPTEMATRY